MALPDPSQLYTNVENQLRGYGNAEQGALYQNYQNAMGQGMQNLASSGLAGTSIAPSMKMGFMKQYQLALNNLNQQLTQTQTQAQSTFGLGGIGLQQAQQGLAQSAQRLGQQQQQLNQGQGYLALAQNQQAFGQQQTLQNQGAYQQQQLGPTPYQAALSQLA